jgi:site-specific recombinase XerD
MSVELLDVAGRRRSPATLPGHRRGWPPRNKGRVYPADPPRAEEIIAVMRGAGENKHGARVRALIVILWRAGLRINEALMLAESDLEPQRGAIIVRHGKGGKRREVGMDEWGWEHIDPWRLLRLGLPIGPFLCVLDGATRGRSWSPTGAREELHRLAALAGVRRRFAPHQLRHAHAVEMAREGIPLPVIQRQLGHASRRDKHLSTGHRHQRNHQHHPHAQAAHNPGQRGTPNLTAANGGHGRPPAAFRSKR